MANKIGALGGLILMLFGMLNDDLNIIVVGGFLAVINQLNRQ